MLQNLSNGIIYREEEIKERFESQPKNLMVQGQVMESLCIDYSAMNGISNRFGVQTIKDIVEKEFDKDAIYRAITKT